MKPDDDPEEEFLSGVKCISDAAVPIHFALYWLQLPGEEDCANLYKKSSILPFRLGLPANC